MKDEIKEILDKWKCYIGLTKKFTNNDMELLRVEDIEKVLDCITNLQRKEYNNSKAIEWIRMVQDGNSTKYIEPIINTDELDDLLNILEKGE